MCAGEKHDGEANKATNEPDSVSTPMMMSISAASAQAVGQVIFT